MNEITSAVSSSKQGPFSWDKCLVIFFTQTFLFVGLGLMVLADARRNSPQLPEQPLIGLFDFALVLFAFCYALVASKSWKRPRSGAFALCMVILFELFALLEATNGPGLLFGFGDFIKVVIHLVIVLPVALLAGSVYERSAKKSIRL